MCHQTSIPDVHFQLEKAVANRYSLSCLTVWEQFFITEILGNISEKTDLAEHSNIISFIYLGMYIFLRTR